MQSKYNLGETVLIAAKVRNIKMSLDHAGDPIIKYGLDIEGLNGVVYKTEDFVLGKASPKWLKTEGTE